jgi:c-di-GMP-binding flagellar brake protein YcgR
MNMGWMEKRQYERVDAAVKVSYRTLSKEELVHHLVNPAYRESTVDRLPELSKKSPTMSAVTKDISVGGLSLFGESEFPPDTALEIFLYLPSYPSPITMIAEIVRTQATSSATGELFRAGVKILAINKQDVGRLDRFILAEKLRKHSGGT